MVLVEVAAGAGIKVIFDGVAKGLAKMYEKAPRAHLEGLLAQWRNGPLAETVHQRVDQVRFIKTLWRVDEKLDLLDFYAQPNVESRDVRFTATDYDSFRCDGQFLIEGTVGQGKSMLLRYLTVRELVNSRWLPLFIELRTIQPEESLVEHIVRRMEVLGLRGADKAVFHYLCDEGKILLLLDGFDEVPETERAGRIDQLAELLVAHSGLRVIISSRPGTGIESLPALERFRLSDLRNDEYRPVLERIVADAQVADQITRDIAGQPAVKALLTTPLMVTLLAVQYRAECRVPHDRIGFFRGLFILLLYGHDRAKQGYRRERRSSLSDDAMEKAFNAFCFRLKRDAPGSNFSRHVLVKAADTVFANSGQNVDPGAFVDDIVAITCLILFEGLDARFVHKSVQEFHAACFIRDLPDAVAHRFYSAMVSTGETSSWERWVEELDFLAQLDRVRYLTHFAIPDLERTLPRVKGRSGPEIARELFGTYRVIAHETPDDMKAFHESAGRFANSYAGWQVTGYVPDPGGPMWIFAGPRMNACCRRLRIVVPPRTARVAEWLKSKQGQEVSYMEVVNLLGFNDTDKLMVGVADLAHQLDNAHAEVARAENADHLALEGL